MIGKRSKIAVGFWEHLLSPEVVQHRHRPVKRP